MQARAGRHRAGARWGWNRRARRAGPAGWARLLGARGQLDAGDAGVGVVRHDDGVVARAAGQAAAVARLLLHIADDGTLGHVAHLQRARGGMAQGQEEGRAAGGQCVCFVCARMCCGGGSCLVRPQSVCSGCAWLAEEMACAEAAQDPAAVLNGFTSRQSPSPSTARVCCHAGAVSPLWLLDAGAAPRRRPAAPAPKSSCQCWFASFQGGVNADHGRCPQTVDPSECAACSHSSKCCPLPADSCACADVPPFAPWPLHSGGSHQSQDNPARQQVLTGFTLPMFRVAFLPQ